MQERHDNDEIEPHNHNDYLLLYKETGILTSGLGKFFRMEVLHITCNMCTCDLPDIHVCPQPSGFGYTYQANPSRPCYNYHREF